MNEKYIVQIEFRYSHPPTPSNISTCGKKTITIGIYSTFEEAAENGNKLLETLENRFDLHQFPDGRQATRQRFSSSKGGFWYKNLLISELAYLRTPFSFFVAIEKLIYASIDGIIEEVVDSTTRYKNYRKAEREE